MTRRRLRPTWSARPPAARLASAFVIAESDDEAEDRALRRQTEVVLADQRKHAAFEPDHCADEGVERDEQCELAGVRP